MRRHWSLDPAISFLNHGSFGACPSEVLAEQSRLRSEMEADPVRFLARDLWLRLDEALAALGAFIGADPADLAFVTNATAALNAVLRSLVLKPGDEIFATDHAYEACTEVVRHVAARSGARVVVAQVPFPIQSSAEVVDAVVKAAGPRVRLAVLDHVTSPTALLWPIKELIQRLNERGFLYVRRDCQDGIAPVAVSHLAAWAREGRSAFRARFDWTGTHDPTAALSVPAALGFMSSLLPGGWPAVMADNRELASLARDILSEARSGSSGPRRRTCSAPWRHS